MIYELSSAGIECFDIFTKRGAYAGLVAKKRDVQQALEFMHQRRVKKGWAK